MPKSNVIILLMLITLYVLGLSLLSCNKDKPANPPLAYRIADTTVIHGDTLVDHYYWLREKSNPAVIDYLESENEYTQAKMQPTKKLQKKLYREMKARIKETDLSVPVRIGNYYYYQRLEKGKQYPIYCRKKDSLEAPEEILLDQNKLARKHDYCHIGVFKVSPDHQLLAYSVDYQGDEHYTIHIKHLKSGRLFEDQIDHTYYSLAWTADSHTLFYSTLDSTQRPHKCYRHVLGTDPEKDALMYHEKDPRYYLTLNKTKNGKYILLNLNSEVTSEVRYLQADHPVEDFRLLYKRREDIEYYVYHHNDHFYIRTNDQAKNFKLISVPVKNPRLDNWQVVIPHRKQVKLEAFDFFQNFRVTTQRENGLRTLIVTDLRHQESQNVVFPESVYALSPGKNPEFNTNIFRFNYTSLITPKSVYNYNMQTQTKTLKKQTEVPGGYDKSNFHTERILVPARDGTKVPVSLVHKKGIRKNGRNPLFLYGYGSYGAIIEPRFSANRLSLLNRGFIYAIAHIRGSSIMGREWYEQGKLLHKKNTFYDFIDCAEQLIRSGYTNPEQLVISGGSAGGLLMGAVTNMRPDLFKVVIARVPFVDVVNTMLDPSIPLTVIEYDEWGNPNQKEFYEYIQSYSPYDNVESKAYPHILITAGLNDPRVQYWEPAKWTAKLRANKTDNNLVLLKTDMGKGHFSATGRYDYLKEIAFQYAFIFDRLQINE